MVDIFFDKLYRYDRAAEPCYIGMPVREGELLEADDVCVYQEGKRLPLQTKVTSRHKDGSVRFLFLRFLADLPGNRGSVLQCDLHGARCGLHEGRPKMHGAERTARDGREVWPGGISPVEVCADEAGLTVSTVCEGKGEGKGRRFSFRVENDSRNLFARLETPWSVYGREQFPGPFLKDGEGRRYRMRIGRWRAVEQGPVCAVLKAAGSHVREGEESGPKIDFELKLTAWAGKPWVEVSYRLINTTERPLHVASLAFRLLRTAEGPVPAEGVSVPAEEKPDSTGCGDLVDAQDFGEGPLFHIRGTEDVEKAAERTPVENVRTCAGSSNYRTDFYLGRDGTAVNRVVDADWLMYEANEHLPEVFYGTFFADCTDASGGVCATIFQAQQNYPKAVQADRSGLSVMLVPENVEKVVMQMGMSREQKFLLHFHDAAESLVEIDNRSLIYQMPDRPYLLPEVHKASGVWPDVFAEKWDMDVERCLAGRADGHCRAYGMLNFGDSYDAGYTDQGRGGGSLVWCNNEYDYPHACALLYVRTGIRRFLDYNIASCSHWMDVDVCHYHTESRYIGGQWEHTGGHCIDGTMVCSHEWVEGLLDYYHFTGDERGLETALGIGENVLSLLKSPVYTKVGEANARETGWALRTLTALYVETRNKKWLPECGRILQDFRIWEERYGNWLAPYTDNTVIRVGFMISVAIGSVMRYYREFPDPSLKAMMLRAVDDLIGNCYVEKWGVFYYKELPSLNRPGYNTLLLEALTIAYELSGDAEYLKPGLHTFKKAIADPVPGAVGSKKNVQDAVIVGNASSKNFAQSMIPLAVYYRAASECGIL
ncbi:MAG: glycoside hydrolase family 127 protein [Blautia sp.]|nr:glycoside hydrolase family 127 protein [Blautia sp.]MCM1199721.1 glycoside hydrolase family 127 protein [Bacteroides fragilis]